MPHDDIEEVRKAWELTKQLLLRGLQLTRIGNRIMNNFPKPGENRVSHVRPHAQNAKDTYPLPDGREYTKQWFWLNNTYVFEQVKSYL
jgi:DNA mismatch repair protein MutH